MLLRFMLSATVAAKARVAAMSTEVHPESFALM